MPRLSGRGLSPEHFMIYIYIYIYVYVIPIYTGDVNSTSTKANVHEAYPEKVIVGVGGPNMISTCTTIHHSIRKHGSGRELELSWAMSSLDGCI